MVKTKKIKVVEIFKTVEGEGSWVGLPVSFIRLEGCNLRCPWCDTPYSYDGKSYKEYTIEEIFSSVEKFGLKRLCITGGEPFLTEELPDILEIFLKNGYKVLVETNGTLWNERIKDIFTENLFIVCSPKPPSYYIHPELIPYISELKFVVDSFITFENIYRKEILEKVRNKMIILQPESNLKDMVFKALDLQEKLLKKEIESRIIPQCHKVLGLP
ncbi:MAG: 7-carboxy-7-deazaguanine synthase QueE [Aquificota bacterium]|nr:MAG: 7-carboxy-7-deazaguanine synthase QueE [Aquificota bacterium]